MGSPQPAHTHQANSNTHPPRLMNQIHEVCRRRHLSKRTEEAYRFWIRQFIFHFNKRHPRELREGDVAQFLNHLAVQREVSASTQTQALNALAFLYRDVLETPLNKMPGFNRIQQHRRIPVVMSPEEVSAVLAHMSGSTALMARLLYGESQTLLIISALIRMSALKNILEGLQLAQSDHIANTPSIRAHLPATDRFDPCARRAHHKTLDIFEL
ncbi:phage integrase N-terminal SAM-like domain-containing protein [Candidatus Nitrotoga sp. M5]|uniref:phage integrase N-terminal SAM-like domain-containing protein n=1 Tax=Candidatus Nitrotoga sp. M5 TaxID=2890409 RepID=UPI001EF20834|nr:phage integrase N-terminal SAM-like domain-containing protein [Candidatus Nitrotoga sp. M5]CAH1386491.1 hypothetical protein NTGM5_290090 [Candidatus Nitrotoga sp. M5]